MERERWRRVRQLFEQAGELAPEARAAWLEQACAGDAELRDEVERLLDSEAPASFLGDPRESVPQAAAGEVGRRLGRYRIERALAAGGMGVVYEAWQDDPRRRVALKVLRFGLGGTSGRRRFHDEAEALARLVHPGIAQVYEAGVHVEGGVETPYIAMEFVEEARDLVRYARERELDLGARVELLRSVCEAVHHGHTRGVIHRDLKPANLLVDGAGRTKVIDFGVARLVGEEAGSLATRTGEILGTLGYMSPEQLTGDPAAIDTRSDVYSLGVVLYELLSGRLPHVLSGVPWTAVARIVHEDAPDPLGADLPSDLGWVVLRALEKEPQRRYGSANELALDLQRFLEHEPVLAGPPSTAYRARKFVRRHRVAVAAASAVALALVAGTLAALVGLSRARESAVLAAEENVKFRELNGVLVETLSAVELGREGRELRAYELLDRAALRLEGELQQSPGVRAGLASALAQSYLNLGLRPEAEAQARRALEALAERAPDDVERLEALRTLASCLIDQGRAREALQELDDAHTAVRGAQGELALSLARVALRARISLEPPAALEADLGELESGARELLGSEHPETLKVLELCVRNQVDLDHFDTALRRNDELIELYARSAGPEAFATLRRRLFGAELLARDGRSEEALERYDVWLRPWVERLGEEHPLALTALHGYAGSLKLARRPAAARAVWEPLIQPMERVLGAEHPTTLAARDGLAQVSLALGEARSGEATLRELVESARRAFGPENLRTIGHEANLGAYLADTGAGDAARLDEAGELLEHVLATRRRDLPPDHESIVGSFDALGLLSYRRGEYARAEDCFHSAWEGYRRVSGETHPRALVAISNLSTALARQERYDEALPVALESLRLNRAVRSPDDPALIAMTANLGSLNLLRGAPRQAQGHFEDALEAAAQHLPANEPRLPMWRRSLAECLVLQGHHEQAREVLREVVEASDAAERANALMLDARCLEHLGEPLEAVAALELAYELRLGLAGEGHAETRAVAAELARLAASLEHEDDAATWRALAAPRD